jgi:carbon storage regulator
LTLLAVAAGLVRYELVLALEGADVADRDLELMSDPRVGSSLAHPGADLVQLRFQRSACQAAAHTSNEGYPLRTDAGLALVGSASSSRQGRRRTVLVLTRKANQSIMIGDDIEVSVLAIMGEKVRIGIEAPRSVPVYRKEVYVEIQRDAEAGQRYA